MGTKIVSLKFSSSSSSSHHLRARRVKDVVVLLANVPPWCNEPHLKSLLTDGCGPVKYAKFLSETEMEAWSSPSPPPIPTPSSKIDSPYFKPKTEICFHDALVIFESALAVEALWEMKKEEPLVLEKETRKPIVGMKRWISDYTSNIITDWDHFQKDLDDFMKEYDEKKAAEGAKMKEMGDEPDEDGWVTVTNKSKKPARNPSNKKKNNYAKAKADGEKRELLNFYKFQKKEKKEDLIQSLREKFEEDKKRVATMRAERKFKPY